MKTLKALVVAKSIATAAFVAAGASVLPAPALAAVGVGINPSAGVTCHAGHTAIYDNGVLKCRETVTHTRGSICSPAIFQRSGDITLNQRVELLPSGSDVCRGLNGTTAPTQMTPPLPGMPADSAFTRVVNPTAADTFVATTYRFRFPDGAVFGGNEDHGVRCPSGFGPVRIDGGRGLRCEDVVVKIATCDGGFKIDRRTGEDRCVKVEKDLFGNTHTIVGQYTIPANAGYVGIFGNPESNGWNLDTDRIGSSDYWVKEQRAYSYAESF